MQRGRKGQISLYVIIGLVSLLAIFLYVQNQPSIAALSEIDTALLEAFVQSCLETTLIEGSDLLAGQGGYLLPPEPSTLYLAQPIPYYFTPHHTALPDATVFTKQLEEYVEQNLPPCTDHFSSFPDFRVGESIPTVAVTMQQTEITAELTYPLTIQRGNTQTRLSEWQAQLPSAIARLIELSARIIATQEQDSICLSCMADLAEEHQAMISLTPAGNSTVIVLLESNEGQFVFAMQLSSVPESVQEPFTLTPVLDQVAHINQQYQLQIQANKPALFKDYTDLFEIDQVTGIISFLPVQEGINDILIEAVTEQGETDSLLFTLEVIG